ncbi:hypothetical protein AT864_01395 [Anoxybacillus sp. P3H1B]|uniref:hypothetical protein n=1 Tax=Anoxybacillaceae TaxID=3120669 RepID=UPI000795DA48|nr:MULTISPECIES: hypothetical protein [Anoxybacillus]KXG10804.1 hypothetical protein AT864_01395 [Anoxybacillus sp. P3H1B]MBB3905900.1 hypothetical protein [Anoxybacillus rupiensis]
MNLLRLFNFGRNRMMWKQALRLMGRRNNNRTATWSILSFGLGMALTAVLNRRKARISAFSLKQPLQQAMNKMNSLMNRNRGMKQPSLATVELSQELTQNQTSTTPTNNQPS